MYTDKVYNKKGENRVKNSLYCSTNIQWFGVFKLFKITTRCIVHGRSDGGYIGIYTPKSVTENYFVH